MLAYDVMKKFSKYIDKIEMSDPVGALKQLVKSVIVCVPVLTIELGRKLPLLSKKDQLSFIKLAIICNVAVFAVKILLTGNLFELFVFCISTLILAVVYWFKYKDVDRENITEDEEEDYQEDDYYNT